MHKTPFKDHFSRQSADYKAYRPAYPHQLFDYLASISPARQLAWDCATGSGQAAVLLARHFHRVIASDASAHQLKHSIASENIEYRVMSAEHSELESQSTDLITVAQALHWFDIDRFFQEALRVLKPGGILAVWCYNLLRINEDIDALVDQLYGEVLHDYWPAERSMVEAGYADVNFPLQRLQPPRFCMQAEWSIAQFLGYLRTWSACQAYYQAKKHDPVTLIEDALRLAWGDPQQSRQPNWPLSVIVGKSN